MICGTNKKMSDNRLSRVEQSTYRDYRYSIVKTRKKVPASRTSKVDEEGNHYRDEYRSRIYTRRCKDNGVEIIKERSGAKKADVIKKVQELIDVYADEDERAASGLVDENTTVSELCEKFLLNKQVKQNGERYSPSTYGMYQSHIAKHILPYIGDRLVLSIDRNTLQSLLDYMVESDADYSRSTMKSVRSTINQLMELAVLMNIIKVNPAVKLDIRKEAAEPIEALDETEQRIVVSAMNKLEGRLNDSRGSKESRLYNRAFGICVGLMLYCGLRRGEALGLSVDDVDKSEKYININHQFLYPGNHKPVISRPKSKAGYRNIPVPSEFADILFSYVDNIQAVGQKYLFVCESGDPCTYSSAMRRWQTFLRLCSDIAAEEKLPFDAEKIRMHRLRHTYCTMLYENGVDVHNAAALMGHASIDITNRVYTTLRKNQRNAAAEQVFGLSYSANNA